MTPAPENHHAVKKVVLPSGKTIEIVYFADPDEAAAIRPAAPEIGLHVCPECASELVYPEAWEEAGDAAWELQLRCPNCEWLGHGVYEQPVVEQLDELIDNGTQVLVRDLKQLMQANMQDEVERFIAALHAGHIWPMDF
ncbi:MAG: hypothetical protein M3141_07770 [Actinomycetota bacterium]|nr:hypothetical protein [Actinomycetota bacterium]